MNRKEFYQSFAKDLADPFMRENQDFVRAIFALADAKGVPRIDAIKIIISAQIAPLFGMAVAAKMNSLERLKVALGLTDCIQAEVEALAQHVILHAEALKKEAGL